MDNAMLLTELGVTCTSAAHYLHRPLGIDWTLTPTTQ